MSKENQKENKNKKNDQEFGKENSVIHYNETDTDRTNRSNGGISNNFFFNEGESIMKAGTSAIKPGPGNGRGFDDQPIIKNEITERD